MDVGGVAQPDARDLVLRSGSHWTAGILLAGMGGLHLYTGVPAIIQQRLGAGLSLGLGIAFMLLAVICLLVHREVCICRDRRMVCVRNGWRWVWYERNVPFEDVQAVRLTLSGGRRRHESRIELMCDRESIPCPPSRLARQEALYMAIVMDVRLVKIYTTSVPEPSQRIHELISEPGEETLN